MLPFFAMVMPALVLFCGLAIDVSAMESAKSLDQMAADAAAVSAALEFQRGSGEWMSVGERTVALYGLVDNDDGVRVTVRQRPVSGAYAGRDDAIQVSVTQPAPTYFLRWVRSNPIRATAVALLPPCLFFRGARAVMASGSSLRVSCPVYANGEVSVDGSSSWSSAGLLMTLSGRSKLSGATSVTQPVRDVGDPLSAMAQPRASGCAVTAFKQNGGTVVLRPGTYCNGMTLKNAMVTLTPGLYVITGGARWSSIDLRGEGVTLYFTDGASGYGQFVIDGGSRVRLSAPVDASTNAVPGVLVFSDRAWHATSRADFQITGSQVETNGIWYLAGSGLALSNSTLSGQTYLGLDVDSLILSASTVEGGADMSSVATGSPFQRLGGLAE